MNKLPIELLKEINYINDTKELKKEINDFLLLSKSKKEKVLKKKELEKKEPLFLKNKKYYRDLIFFSKSENVLNEIDLEIVFCNGNKDLVDIWKYFKVMSSSANTSDDSFGSIKIMLKDKNTNKYIGILEISCDIYSCDCRDLYIGWTSENKKQKTPIINNLSKDRIAFIINITCCIGLQPMAYNLNIGKLLVMTVFSKEVMEYFKERRGYYYYGVSTFGLYGKSIQYDRLNEIKYIGETKGNGTCEIPIDLYDNIRNYVKEYYPEEYLYRSKMTSSKMRILQFGLNRLDLNFRDILLHGKKRGVYFGYIDNKSKDFLKCKIDIYKPTNIKSFNEIFNYWKQRWGNKRLLHLLKENKFKVKYELKDFTLKERKNEYSKQYNLNLMNDENWLKYKKEKSKIYYENNKDNILEELKIDFDKINLNYKFIDSQFLSGFFDADGSVYISKDTLFVSFTQCVLNILLSIQKEYGGTIFKRLKRNENQRDQYTLRIVGLETKKILDELEKNCILKFNKVNKALDYIKHINKENSLEKDELIKFIRDKNKEDNEELFNRINWKYISGLFDGDGCITLNYKDLEMNKINPKLSIAQKYTPSYLNYLKVFMSNGLQKMSMSKFFISTSSKILIEFIYEKIKNYIIVKKYQYDMMINIFNELKKDSLIDYNKIIELANLIKNNKHQNIEYDIDINKVNLVSSIKNNIINSTNNDINNIIIKETNTKIIQSEKKMGLNNPNYGKKISEDHALNISIATTNSKRANNENLTNDKIREIFALKTIFSQKDVSEKYGMNREMIRRIWTKKILPTDDPDFINKKKELIENKTNNKTNPNITPEQKTSIGKRSLNIDEYIIILQWKNKKNNGEKLNDKIISSPKLAEYLSNIWNKKVSADTIKNIWIGRTKLFDFEFIDKCMNYEEYLKIIEV